VLRGIDRERLVAWLAGRGRESSAHISAQEWDLLRAVE
jgi:hypothetical protein